MYEKSLESTKSLFNTGIFKTGAEYKQAFKFSNAYCLGLPHYQLMFSTKIFYNGHALWANWYIN